MNDRINTLITLAKTADLVAFYNAFAVKAVTKFSDRATAEKRIAQLVEDMVAAGQFCPFCDALDADACGKELTWADSAEKHYKHHACGKVFTPQGKLRSAAPTKSSTDRAAAISASWDVVEVAVARTKRDRVVVEGVGEFRSVKDAFMRLGLPLSKHIRFRMQLKASRAAQFEGKQFKLAAEVQQ